MPVRTDLSNTSRHTQMTLSRATVREVDDNHLMQEIKKADVHHSETPSDFERWQMVGLTAVPLKQEETKQTQNQDKTTNASEQGDWNHNQPQGKSAEAVMLYVGSRSHPIGLVDDRRVRPYAMNPGETALYAASGTGQMLYHNDAGSYLVAVNNAAEQATDSSDKERFASLRHVQKKKQSREIKEGQTVDKPHHEGETVNLEVRATSSRIEFRAGDSVVGYYDKGSSTWVFKGTVMLGDDDTSKMRKVHRKGDIDSGGDAALTTALYVWAK